jgi:hypothetical protein
MILPEHHRAYAALLMGVVRDCGGTDSRAASKFLRDAKVAARRVPHARRARWVMDRLGIDGAGVERGARRVVVIDGHRVSYWSALKCHVRRGDDHVGYTDQTDHPLLAARVVERTAYGADHAAFRSWALQHLALHCDTCFASK